MSPQSSRRLPNELYRAIIQHLKGKYSTLFRVALSCKLLRLEAYLLLYYSLTYNVTPHRHEKTQERRFFSLEVPGPAGPPPKVFIDNPKLARYLRRIESPHGWSSPEMQVILSAAFSRLLHNLKFLSLSLGSSIRPGILTHGKFEVLHLNGPGLPDHVARLLSCPKLRALKNLRIIQDEKLPVILPPIGTNLETLKGSTGVIEALLPLRNIKTLVWVHRYNPPPSYVKQQPKNFDHLSKELNSLTTLSYALMSDIKPFLNIANHLRNLQFLIVKNMWDWIVTDDSKRPYKLDHPLNFMPEILSKLPNLIGLFLRCSEHRCKGMLSGNSKKTLFEWCPTLQFIEAEEWWGLGEFHRWGRDNNEHRKLRYGRLPDDIRRYV